MEQAFVRFLWVKWSKYYMSCGYKKKHAQNESAVFGLRWKHIGYAFEIQCKYYTHIISSIYPDQSKNKHLHYDKPRV